MLWFGLRRRIDELELELDALGADIDTLAALPGEVHDLAERANRALARLNARARRAAERDDDEEEEQEPQLELVNRLDPVSERIIRERELAKRKDG